MLITQLKMRKTLQKGVNRAVRDDENDCGEVQNDSNRWVIGSKNRNVGSIHSDIWEGTASELSQSKVPSVPGA